MSARRKKRLYDLLRIAVCALALWIVIRGVTFSDRVTLQNGEVLRGDIVDDGDPLILQQVDGTRRSVARSSIAADQPGGAGIVYGLKTSWHHSRGSLLLLALLIHFPVGLLQAVRLMALLRVQQIRLSYWKCVKLSFAGNFLNFATPLGSNAGDVFKAYFVTTHTEQKTEAASTIAFDRAIGVGTLLLCVAAITTFASGDTRLALFQPYVLALLGVGVAGTIVYLSPAVRSRIIPRRRLSRLPMIDQLRRIDRAARTLAGHLPTLLWTVLVTVTLQLLAMSAYFCVAKAVGLQAHAQNVLEFFAYFYTGAVIQALPGPPQGLGTVELVYRYFLAPFGGVSQIVCMAFLIRVVVLTCALPGLLVTMTGSYKPRPGSETASQTESLDACRLESERDMAAT